MEGMYLITLFTWFVVFIVFRGEVVYRSDIGLSIRGRLK